MARISDQRPHRSLLTTGSRWWIAMVAALLAGSAIGQEEPQPETPAASTPAQPQKIAAPEVPTRAAIRSCGRPLARRRLVLHVARLPASPRAWSFSNFPPPDARFVRQDRILVPVPPTPRRLA